MAQPALDDALQDVPNTVCAIVAEALAVDAAEVRTDSVLMEELGAESIDFLDIVFKLEQTFDIQITRGALEKAARGDMSEEDFAPSGIVSDEGLERLRVLMPEAADRIQQGMRPAQILSLFTPQTFANIVQAQRAAKGSA